MAGDYKPDRAATGAWLRRDGDLRGACQGRADAILAVAKAIAPVRTGHYKAMLHTAHGRGWDGRVAVDVIAPVPYASAVEYRHHVLLRAAQTI